MQSVGMMVFWFVAIVALIPVTLFVLKRSGLAQGAIGAAGSSAPALKTVGQVNLGPGQRVVAVELNSGDDKTWLVLGVTNNHSIRTLHAIKPAKAIAQDKAQDKDGPAVEKEKPQGGFPMLLRRATDFVDQHRS